MRAIGLGLPEEDLVPQVSNAFRGPIQAFQEPSPLDVTSPDMQDTEKEPHLDPEIVSDPAGLNRPHDYSGLVGPMPFSIVELFHLGVRTIAIDPGHGGKDSGALGPGGLKEKDLTLDIAKRLRDRLEKHWNHRIILTRDWDFNVPLKRR
ncbi:MAG: N-acetylmuramoyl-L-alanine amidase family protein, partial [Deltaproteobacteria bacterium]